MITGDTVVSTQNANAWRVKRSEEGVQYTGATSGLNVSRPMRIQRPVDHQYFIGHASIPSYEKLAAVARGEWLSHVPRHGAPFVTSIGTRELRVSIPRRTDIPPDFADVDADAPPGLRHRSMAIAVGHEIGVRVDLRPVMIEDPSETLRPPRSLVDWITSESSSTLHTGLGSLFQAALPDRPPNSSTSVLCDLVFGVESLKTQWGDSHATGGWRPGGVQYAVTLSDLAAIAAKGRFRVTQVGGVVTRACYYSNMSDVFNGVGIASPSRHNDIAILTPIRRPDRLQKHEARNGPGDPRYYQALQYEAEEKVAIGFSFPIGPRHFARRLVGQNLYSSDLTHVPLLFGEHAHVQSALRHEGTLMTDVGRAVLRGMVCATQHGAQLTDEVGGPYEVHVEYQIKGKRYRAAVAIQPQVDRRHTRPNEGGYYIHHVTPKIMYVWSPRAPYPSKRRANVQVGYVKTLGLGMVDDRSMHVEGEQRYTGSASLVTDYDTDYGVGRHRLLGIGAGAHVSDQDPGRDVKPTNEQIITAGLLSTSLIIREASFGQLKSALLGLIERNPSIVDELGVTIMSEARRIAVPPGTSVAGRRVTRLAPTPFVHLPTREHNDRLLRVVKLPYVEVNGLVNRLKHRHVTINDIHHALYDTQETQTYGFIAPGSRHTAHVLAALEAGAWKVHRDSGKSVALRATDTDLVYHVIITKFHKQQNFTAICDASPLRLGVFGKI